MKISTITAGLDSDDCVVIRDWVCKHGLKNSRGRKLSLSDVTENLLKDLVVDIKEERN